EVEKHCGRCALTERTSMFRSLCVTLAAGTMTVAGIAAQEKPLPRAPGAQVVTITPAGRTGSEPAIAVNHLNPAQVVAFGGGWAAYSTDFGSTFTPVQPGAAGGRSGGDPSLVF